MAAALQPLQGVGNKIADAITRITGGKNDDLIRDLDEKLESAREDRRPFEPQWLVNFSFYMGKQWVIWSEALGTLDKPAIDPWRVRPNINMVRPAVLTSYAKIIQTRQIGRTQPGGSGPDDEKDAKACDKLLDYIDPVSGAEVARSEAAIMMLIFGTALLKDCWDPSAGMEVGTDPQTGKPLHRGEMVEYAVSPFEFFGEPGCKEISEMDWCFHVTLRPASYIKKVYDVDVEESEYDSSMTFDSNLKNIISGNSSKTKGTVLKEWFKRPDADSPNGKLIVYANDTIISDGDNPNIDDPLPFTKLMGHPRPTSFWGVSFVDDMIDPQRIYNKTKGEALEIQRMTSKPKYTIPIGSLPQGKEITNAPGDDLRYVPVNGLKPEIMKGADIPQGYFKVMEETKQEIYDTSGQHEVSHGQSPFTRTATGIQYLQEQDDQRLAPMVRNFDRAFEQTCEVRLRLARQNYEETRTLEIIGPDNKTELVSFMKDQIPDNIHVHIQAGGQALPRSRVARQDYLLKLWTTNPPIIDDPKMMLDLLEFGNIEGLFDQLKQDVAQAGRENDAMSAPPQPGMEQVPPQPVPVRDFHNHVTHIKEHNKLRNSTQYDELPPLSQGNIDTHVQAHQLAYAQQVANLAANTGGGGATLPRSIGSGRGPLSEQTGPTPSPAAGGGE